MPVRPRGTDCARVIQVIETRTLLDELKTKLSVIFDDITY